MELYSHYFTHNSNAIVSIIIALLAMAGLTVWLVYKKNNAITIVASWLVFLAVLVIGFDRLIHEDLVQREMWEKYLCDLTATFAKSTQELGHDRIRPDRDYQETYDRIIDLHKIWCRDLDIVGYVFTLRLIGPERVEYICSCPSDIDGNGIIEGPTEVGDPPFTPYLEEGEYAWYDVYAGGFAGKTAIDPEVDSNYYGRWVTAVSPLYDSSGAIEGILGVDFRVDQWEAYTGQLRNKSLALLNAICLVVFCGVFLLAHLHQSLVSSREVGEKMRLARQNAEAASQAKSEFLANMSHEIRTPISGVIGLSDLLIGTELGPKQYEYAQLIKASGQSLLFLINDILDFSKIEAGKLELDAENFDLIAMVESVVGILASRTEEKKIDLCTAFGYGLPRRVIGDTGRVRQILLNLVVNAVKFTQTGGVSIRVIPEGFQDNQIFVRFRVKDTGIGIPKDRIDRLFKAFSQVDSSSARTYGGTGLGLAISLRLVRLMHGEIGVESEPGQGSEFWFRVPFECDPKVVACLQDSKHKCRTDKADACEVNGHYFCVGVGHRGMNSGFTLEGTSVLVAVNSEIQRKTLCEQLKTWGMVPDCATTPEETVEKLVKAESERRPYSLLMIDKNICSDREDELTLIRRIRSTSGLENIAMILMLPLSEKIDKQFFAECSVEYLSKPLFTSALFDAIMNRLYRDESAEGGEREPGLIARTEKHRTTLDEPVHILVAEDNRINQIVIQNVLRDAGFTSEIVGNGHEALNAVMTRPFDLLLMDCQMPEMDGYEATTLIRKWEQDRNLSRIPIIALTANAIKGDEQKCLDAGMDAYCSKPVDPKIVIQTIEYWFNKTRAR